MFLEIFYSICGAQFQFIAAPEVDWGDDDDDGVTDRPGRET